MNLPTNLPRTRLRLLFFALLVLVAVGSTRPRTAAALGVPVCVGGAVGTEIYYSDPTYTTEIGRCTKTCCSSWHCTGNTSMGYRVENLVTENCQIPPGQQNP